MCFMWFLLYLVLMLISHVYVCLHMLMRFHYKLEWGNYPDECRVSYTLMIFCELWVIFEMPFLSYTWSLPPSDELHAPSQGEHYACVYIYELFLFTEHEVWRPQRYLSRIWSHIHVIIIIQLAGLLLWASLNNSKYVSFFNENSRMSHLQWVDEGENPNNLDLDLRHVVTLTLATFDVGLDHLFW